MTSNMGFKVPVTPFIQAVEGLDKLTSGIAQGISNGINQAAGQISSPDFQSKLNSSLTKMGRIASGDTSGITDPNAKVQAENLQMISKGMDKMSDTFKSMLTKSFDVLDTIYKELKKSSPLLQAVEQLFNLAMQLFFMPLGNKLGEVLIPAVINLLDEVMAFWDEIGDGGLGEIFGKAVEWGVNALGNFILNISNVLKGQGGLLGSIGSALDAVGAFMKNGLVGLLNMILSLVSIVIGNLKHIISAIITFKVASLAMQAGMMYVIATSNTLAGKFGLGLVAATVGAGVVSEAALTNWGLAEGGYVPATPGGQVHLLAEGGEGEYVIPESKMGQMGGNYYTINNYCYSTDELKSIIKEVISDEVSMSRLRGGF